MVYGTRLCFWDLMDEPTYPYPKNGINSMFMCKCRKKVCFPGNSLPPLYQSNCYFLIVSTGSTKDLLWFRLQRYVCI